MEVVCHEKIILKTTTISTVTKAPTTATAAVPSTTVTETSTITTSSVVVPDDVSTTLSYRTTSTITETCTAPAVTDTVTATTTVTAAISTTSEYAACATNNIAGAPLSSDLGSLAGEYIYSLSWGTVSGYSSLVSVSTSAEACCISCQETRLVLFLLLRAFHQPEILLHDHDSHLLLVFYLWLCLCGLLRIDLFYPGVQ
jgi:Predicted solute binding protein